LRFTTWSVVRAVLLTMAALGVAAAFQAATRPLSWLLVALFLAGLLRPLATRLSRHMPRGVAIAVVALGSVALVGFLVYRSLDDVQQQAERIQEAAPSAARDLEQSDRYGELAREVELEDKVDGFVADLPQRLQGGSSVDALRSAATRGAAYLATFILMVFLLVSGDRTVNGLLAQVRDPDRQALLDRVVRKGYHRWWTYVTLALARSLGIGLLTFGVCTWLNIPAPTVLAIWVGAWSLVPGVGILVGSLAPVLLAVLGSFGTAGWLLLAALLLQIFDATVTQPAIERRSMHVGPFLTLLAAVLGLELYGVGGMVGAVAITVLVVGALDEVAPSDHSDVTEPIKTLLPDEEPTTVDGDGLEGEAGTAPTVSPA
jgi:predicted PurR-regulated permease PerM